MSVIVNHNYRIGTDLLEDGRILAKARGRKHNQKTFPSGTAHEDAAATLAAKIEGERFHHVEMLTANHDTSKCDYRVFVNNGSQQS